MINRPTCFKNPEKASCIDLILTNRPRNFQNSCAIEARLSNFHKLVVTIMKTTYKKLQPKIISIVVTNISIMKVLEKGKSITFHE